MTEEKAKTMTRPQALAALPELAKSTLAKYLSNEEFRADLFPGAKKERGRWVIPVEDVETVKRKLAEGYGQRENSIALSEMLPPGKAVFGLHEIAGISGLSYATIKEMRARGKLPGVYLSRPEQAANQHNPWQISRGDLITAFATGRPVPGPERLNLRGYAPGSPGTMIYLPVSEAEGRRIAGRLTPEQRYLILGYYAGLDYEELEEALAGLAD